MRAGKYIWEFGGKNLKARCHLENLGKDRKIILNWIFKKQIGFIWVRIGTRGQAPMNP
jgi:hypothetical protein